MSAHSRPFQTQCQQPFCPRLATEEVFNTYNAAQGKFCRIHAAERVKQLREGERPVAPSGGQR